MKAVFRILRSVAASTTHVTVSDASARAAADWQTIARHAASAAHDRVSHAVALRRKRTAQTDAVRVAQGRCTLRLGVF
jgi:hypothetical protein